jgi:hypothetical protein
VRASTTPRVSSPPPSAEARAVPPATTSAVPPSVEAAGAARKESRQEALAPAPVRGPSDEEQIRALVGDYGRAIATKDLELFRRVKPNLSGDEEHRLKEAFEVGEQDVEIQITAVDVSGDRAEVRLVRHDTIGGNVLAPFKQVLSLRRGPGGWRVESIGR